MTRKRTHSNALPTETDLPTRLGKVEDGNSVTDCDVDEIKRNMSISLALAPVEYGGCKINVVDVPVYARDRLAPGMTVSGPALIEQADTTTMLEPGWHASVADNEVLLVTSEVQA